MSPTVSRLARAGAIVLGALACLAAVAAWLNSSPAPRSAQDPGGGPAFPHPQG